jgi:hypothetical protein
MNEEKKQQLYSDDPEGWKAAKERAARDRDKEANAAKANKEGIMTQFGGVERYRMVAKRIW